MTNQNFYDEMFAICMQKRCFYEEIYNQFKDEMTEKDRESYQDYIKSAKEHEDKLLESRERFRHFIDEQISKDRIVSPTGPFSTFRSFLPRKADFREIDDSALGWEYI